MIEKIEYDNSWVSRMKFHPCAEEWKRIIYYCNGFKFKFVNLEYTQRTKYSLHGMHKPKK